MCAHLPSLASLLWETEDSRQKYLLHASETEWVSGQWGPEHTRVAHILVATTYWYVVDDDDDVR